ncbi:class I SAM-dependent methyltransferase [Methylophilus sp. TWE2]|uniref:class I SAM-dependent methyltransferase n=1 Tax=Methylophilus sp. TWE2 TaxID=1662285 RepID=UPI00067090EF|nr:class I SAM-dependent methyltransferase [Methylophilus sp. TWE2]AKR43193.1 SAM-dependent methyltransferase [Methylophilus sp. TWE2]
MNQEELKAVFDKQASGYEQQQKKLAPVHEGLYFQLEWIFSELPPSARILCVGLGAGAELSYLASKFPHWRFTAVEPSGAMLEVCRQRAEKEGFISRCVFHEGYVETLPDIELHDAATCFMVSQFILDKEARSNFFRAISQRLKQNGILVSADLSSTVGSPEYEALLKVWVSMLHAANVPAEAIERTHAAWAKDVAILPPDEVRSIIQRGGFESPVQFYQAGFVHAWFSVRSGYAANKP